jgi:hypothetical protein
MKKAMLLMVLFLLLAPIAAWAQNNGLSIGFGFSFLTPQEDIGKVKEDRSYNFEHLAYFHQFSIFRNGYIILEPFVALVNKPETGLEFGATLSFRYHIPTSERTSLFFNVGGGGAHSTIDFLEQGTRNFFILAGGIGFKWGDFFIENRFRHYSYAHLATPNVSVNADIIMIGFNF